MSELRYNLITREWVIIASERAKRPHDFKKQKSEIKPLPKYRPDCPFCPGNEGKLSDETFRLGNQKNWKTRSIYNKFPALSHTAKEERVTSGPYKHISGFGIHEVIVEHPDHNTSIALMSDDEVKNIIVTYKSRYSAIQDENGIQAITIFKNHGFAAGCSQEHPHSQLVATPIVPPQLRNRMETAVDYFDITGKCLLCDTLEQELLNKTRIVAETEKFAAFIPYASAAPFIIWIVPRRHMASFDKLDEKETIDLARILKDSICKLYHGLDNPDFNYTIRSVPVKEKWNESYHWYLAIVPRLTMPAGFELGSGIFVNASIPEESAEFLRQIKY